MLDVDWTKRQLLILPFDHRGSFMKKLFGISGRLPMEEETSEISRYKMIIYEGFKQAVEKGVPKEIAGILVDEQFGSAILRDAKQNGITFAIPCEKSGQDEFDFEYGEQFGEHIEKFDPSFAKVLVRLNPEDDAGMNQRQLARLKQLGDYLKSKNRAYLFELLVPANEAQLKQASDQTTYDRDVRPKLMVQAIAQIQKAGVEPDIWKLEGVEKGEDAKGLARQVQAAGRKAGMITLGRGESKEKVQEWLKVGAKIPGIIGFAVGRTIFWDALKGLKEGKHDKAAAVQAIANNYYDFVQLWMSEKQNLLDR
ncbi:MAG TPA: DUF2090 domain-containing protein [Candidatus Bilamarchaeaceae archaeon]|nr:DUF2090 domain-containing protein [Candidatus Bilamarchaeaceae archaeon]